MVGALLGLALTLFAMMAGSTASRSPSPTQLPRKPAGKGKAKSKAMPRKTTRSEDQKDHQNAQERINYYLKRQPEAVRKQFKKASKKQKAMWTDEYKHSGYVVLI